jgi:hypothetical protein
MIKKKTKKKGVKERKKGNEKWKEKNKNTPKIKYKNGCNCTNQIMSFPRH